MADASNTPGPELPELELGTYGAIRLKVAPRITLEAGTTEVTLETVKSSNSFKVSGKGKNLVVGQNIPCSLEWLWLAEPKRSAGEAPVLKRHPRDTVLVPADGGGFSIKEGKKDAPKPLVFDAIEMGVLGSGQLGYIITLEVIGTPEHRCVVSGTGDRAHAEGQCKNHHLVVTPDRSKLKVELPVPVAVRPQRTPHIGTAVEVSWPAWVKGATESGASPFFMQFFSASPLSSPQTSVPTWADPCKVVFECAEYRETTDDGVTKLSRVPDTEMVFEISSPGTKGGAVFRLGTESVMEKGAIGPWPPTSFRYHNAGSVPHDHQFGWRVIVSGKPAPPPAGAPSGSGAKKNTPPEPEASTEPVLFAKVPHPHLDSFEIGSDFWQHDLWVSCALRGFDHEVDLRARLDLWAHSSEPNPAGPGGVPPALDFAAAPVEKVYPITSVLPPEFLDDQSRTTVVQFARATFGAKHSFTAHVLALGEARQGTSLRTALNWKHPGIRLFAALSFDPSSFGSPRSVVFMRVAQYTPTTKQHEDASGHAPFADGVFVHEVAAPSICTAQIDLDGHIEPLVGTSGIGVEQLLAIMPNLPEARAREYVPYLNTAMASASITTPIRQAMFLAQVAHESVQLLHFEEIASGAAYEGRADLDNTQPGDGVRFKGRGPIQVTGRFNYQAAGAKLQIDLVGNPALGAEPDVAFRMSAWYWETKKLNQLADQNKFAEVTRGINGGMTGQPEREAFFSKAKSVLGL